MRSKRSTELAESTEVASLRESLADSQERPAFEGMASEIVDDLAAGDLQAAKQKFQDIQQQIESGTLSEAERQQLANDLDKIGQSLENSSASETGQSMRRPARRSVGDNQGASQQLGKPRRSWRRALEPKGSARCNSSRRLLGRWSSPRRRWPRSMARRGSGGAAVHERIGAGTGPAGEQDTNRARGGPPARGRAADESGAAIAPTRG